MAQIISKFLQNDSVVNPKIADGAVSEIKIADGAVTNSKVFGGVDANKIADGSVDNATFQRLAGVTSPIQTQLNNKIDSSEIGVADGVASLDSNGKIPAAQLPNSAMEYKGSWNAAANTPTLADGTGNAGDVYRVSVAGTQDLGSGSISFLAGDLVIYNGTVWEKSPSGITITAMAKQTFVLTAQDITNQYIDLAEVAQVGSVNFMVRGAPVLFEGASYDYTVNYTGGQGGKTRIDFVNDLLPGGNSPLVAGDVVQVQYSY
jgi:hypothetical protein